MNNEFPTDPRKALETSLTALLLGELPEDQERFLRQAIATDPELAKTYEALNKTIALLRETEAEPSAEPINLKLSDERRAKLLQQFKTVRPPAFSESVRRRPEWLVPVAASGVLLLVLSALLLPALSRSKSSAHWGESDLRHLVELRENVSRPPGEKEATVANRAINESGNRIEELLASNVRRPDDTPSSVRRSKEMLVDERKAALLQSNIILPPTQNLEFTLNASSGENRSWGFHAPPQSAGLITSAATSPSFDAHFTTFGPIQENREGIMQSGLALGDTPALGGMFQPAPKTEQTMGTLSTNGVSSGWSTTAGGGDFYGGGAFGGFSTVERVPAGQSYYRLTIPGVGEVPVLQQQLVDNEKKLPIAQDLAAAAPPAIQSEPASKSTSQAGRDFALAEEPKQKVESELKRTLARGDTLADTLDKKVAGQVKDADRRSGERKNIDQEDKAAAKPAASPMVPQPEVSTRANPFSTFSLNVSDVSFKLAAASLEKGLLPDPGSIRSEEFINAFDYRDPEPAPGTPVAFAFERAQYPFSQNRDLLRFSIKTAAAGRQAGRPLNLVLLLDNSGSMERADRVQIIREALHVLATQLKAEDTFSVVTFARTARLWVDGVPGSQAGRVADELSALTPEGGTNLEEAMNLAYQTALRHYSAIGINRVVLLTDGAANLGDINPEVLKQKVETNRKQGIALDCFGIGWEGYNDDLLEQLTRNGDGRYGFLNTPEEAASGFASQLAGALKVAASDVKVQVEFNPNRVTSYRQVGYAKHQLTKEQFRDNSVDAAEIGAAESGNALYVLETNPQGDGPLATVRVRYKVPGTADYREHEWTVPFTGTALPLEQASPAMRLAAGASAFSEWLASSPYAAEVAPDRLLSGLSGVPAAYGADPRPQKLEWMIRQAKAISGK